MRGFVLNQYEPNPSKFDQFHYFSDFFLNVKTNVNQMSPFSTFSQSPSPQTPWDPSNKILLAMAVPVVVLAALYDQMAPQLCPFEISNFMFLPLRPDVDEEITTGNSGRTILFVFY